MFLIFSNRIIDIIDGAFGSLNKTTNSFNGMIGMVQRKVEIHLQSCVKTFLLSF